MIGQSKIQEIAKVLRKTPIEELANLNFLITGRAGLGKTFALFYLAKNLQDPRNSVLFNPEECVLELFQMYRNKEVFIVDEVHKANQVLLYPFMKDHLFLIATNLSDELKEALVSRCVEIELAPYSNTSLIKIVKTTYPGLSCESLSKIEERLRGTPRDVLQLASLLSVDENIDLNNLGFYVGGFREEDQRYLNYMETVKTSSYKRLREALGFSHSKIQYVEEFLLRKNLIEIGTRRKLL